MKTYIMELQISILSDDNEYALLQTRQLKKDFDFYAPELEVTQMKQKLHPEDAAFNLMDTVLQVFLGKNFIEKITDIVKVWVEKRADVINAKKAKIQFDIKDSNGQNISLTLENVKDAEKLLAQLKNFNTTI
jgi:hypothetical protein